MESSENTASQKRRGNPNWKKGVSGNSKGRPKGLVDQRMKVTKLLMDDAEEVVRVVIESALNGDVHSASLVLSRVAPVLKSQAENVSFEFDSKASISAQVEQVLQAIADGEVSPDTGRCIIGAISDLAGVRQIDAVDQRLAALEGK